MEKTLLFSVCRDIIFNRIQYIGYNSLTNLICIGSCRYGCDFIISMTSAVLSFKQNRILIFSFLKKYFSTSKILKQKFHKKIYMTYVNRYDMTMLIYVFLKVTYYVSHMPLISVTWAKIRNH